VVATLIRLTGDWDLAEECAQDAFARALERWPRGALDGYYLLPATRADLLRRLDRRAEAAYREALELATTDAERRYLARRLAKTTGQG
jgi:predicted RNA polymerase sigma factor